ncbi:MAG: Rieske (2Fe-2S) protein [Gammaproteobacteria bacterium]
MTLSITREMVEGLRGLPAGRPVRIETASGASLIAILVCDDLHVYVNACPHRGTELDWNPGAFLSPDGRHLQCATHGARFDPATGFCLTGPCAGESLERVAITD